MTIGDVSSPLTEDPRFGPSPPSLLDFLKKVLREYTDGQIMKEIVQNAEDAGAKTVRFLYDCREHGTSRLHWPSLAPFQGRALYAYNDALFKDRDWEGIQRPARSNKEDNPLKVGRFGIGFSSVYHLTDLPSILSGDTLAFIDPHERHFGKGETGTKLSVTEHADTFNSPDFVDQFTPYNTIFQESTYTMNCGEPYDGTLFRFPIRQEGSTLCENEYDDAAMERLLESFIDDADVVLLFLRSLETIDISRRLNRGQTQIRSRAEICPISLEDMKSKRRGFSRALEENGKMEIRQRARASLTHQLTLTVEVAESKRRMDWIVSQVVGGKEMPDNLMSIADKNGYLPWVGVAMPYNLPRKKRDGFRGRVFCFLPLPPGDESLTGLPVHIHGFFGVNSDRRSIKWPGADRIQGDVDARWNFLLVTKLMPDAYMDMLMFAIREQKLSPDEIYRSWPDPDKVRPEWKRLLKPIFQLLIKLPVIYTTVDNETGLWVKIEDAVFNFMTGEDKNTERILLNVLKAAKIPVAEVPEHIKKAIKSKEYVNFNAKVISPEIIIDCIHKSQHGVLETLSSDDKMSLLEYIMMKTKTPRLIGLRLLPLANGDFAQFSTRSASTPSVFIPTRELDKSLCYNMGNRLILPNINENLHKLLQKAAGHGSVQLQMMSDKNLARLIRDTLPKEWFSSNRSSTLLWHPGKGNQPPREWLHGIWNFLNTIQRKSIGIYEGLPLIQVEEKQSGEVVLTFLKRNATNICQNYGSDKLDRKENLVLTKIGLVVCSCPPFIDTARLIGEGYLRSPTRKGVIGALTAVQNGKSLQKTVENLPKEERRLLVRLCTNCSLTDAERNVLAHIPFFDTIPRSPFIRSKVMSAGDERVFFCRMSSDQLPNFHLPDYDLICCLDNAILNFISNLGMKEKERKDWLKDIVNTICNGSQDRAALQEVGLWILHDLKAIKRDIGSHLLKLKSCDFILTRANGLKSPECLFDPEDRHVSALFGNGFFPSGRYVNEGLLGSLRELGLRHKSSVKANELGKLAEEITKESNANKAGILMSLLGEYPDKLKEPVASESGLTLQQFLADKKCIPCLQESPEFYPQDIPWHRSKGEKMISPGETVMSNKVNILASGATTPFPKEGIPKTLLRSLGVKQHANITSIIQQIAAVSKSLGGVEASDKSTKLDKMVHAIYTLLSRTDRNEQVIPRLTSTLPACIWTGTQFVDIHRAVLSSEVDDFHPYIYSIPKEFREKYQNLFLTLGVQTSISLQQIHDTIMQIHKLEPKLGSVTERMNFCIENKRVVLKALRLLHKICEGNHCRYPPNTLVPTSNENSLELVKPGDCVYEDGSSRGDSDEVQDKLKEDKTFIVDGSLPIAIIRSLGIPPLSRKILAPEDLIGIEQAGQYEPLTTRLKNIIKDGYLESSIPKEMIQNAEDAGATKVHFMLDLRENSEVCSSLFDKGMTDCQGPALWVFNDACFSPDDFQNITKLGGATKELDTSKIGRFGLGFNSVYHLTDVPSFLSREYLQIFDPHTVHLGSMLRSKESPGIRIKLQGNNAISMYRDQFAPYEGVFNCCLQENDGNVYYDGTLFRLPLRSRHAALNSEISGQHYDEHKCKSLLVDLWRSSEDLLVFTKNVREVKTFVLPSNAKQPSESSPLFEIGKEPVAGRDIIAEFMQSKGDARKQKQIKPLIQEECVVRSLTPFGKQYLKIHEKPRKHELMSVTSVGTTSAYKMWQTSQGQKTGLAPVGGVAVKLPLSDKLDGKLYNGLPLAVPHSHLPCHCNGFFAISADRRNLWKPAADSDFNYFMKWNEAVFEDVISPAYMTLLTNDRFRYQVSKMPSNIRISGVNSSPTNFYTLWPKDKNIPKGSDGYAMVKGFYKRLVVSDSLSPNIFWEGEKTWAFKEAMFVDPVLHEIPHIGVAVKTVLQMQHTKRSVTEMPTEIRLNLERMGYGEQLRKQTCTERDFFLTYFLPKISIFPSEVREPLIHYCLQNTDLRETLKTISCIPTSPDGKILKRPGELIHPHGKAGNLFTNDDGRFPHGSFANWDCLHILVHLGMVQDDISDMDFIKCAQKLAGEPIHHEYDRILVDYLTYRLKSEECSWAKDQSLRNKMSKVAFLPVTYMNSSMRKASCDTIFVPERLALVSDVYPVLDESNIRFPFQVKRFLGIVHEPKVGVVLQQLNSIICRPEICGNLLCRDIYEYLDARLKKEENIPEIRKFFQTKECLLVGKTFRSSDQLALDFEEESVGSYLFRLPSNLRSFDTLLTNAGIRIRFSTNDFVSTLKHINDTTSGKLDHSAFEEVMKLIKCLVNAASTYPMEMQEVSPNDIYVPDTNGYLRTADKLSFCDVDWISVPDGVIKAHGDIPLPWARKLGVRDIRQHILESYSVPVPGLNKIRSENLLQFGQREPLTERIKNILKGYPCDDTILKELVQNADDSCATEVHLVLDLRTHPKDRLFKDEMSHLQGPAICVYNNKAFTDGDIEGIQRLGVGGKRDLSSKVGRFGVGFNAVYHLTDCPSFYTNGDTLGMFDPNVAYVPNATQEYPGFMVKPTGKLTDDFPNVFNCYLPDFFDIKDSTMFRLPLRTEFMAKLSKISPEAHEPDSIKPLIQKFKEGLPELLLFLSHVKKVSISTIDESGNMIGTSSVHVSISESEQHELDTFLTTISTEEIDPVTGAAKSLRDIPVTKVHYDIRVTVTEQRAKDVKTQTIQTEDWLICQQHGFENTNDVPDTLLESYNSGYLHVLPLGGVAVPLGNQQAPAKAYSFLPLPIETGLPVHVNGSIELDERRRDIWRACDDTRAQWNRQLMKKIVSHAYVKALCSLQDKIMARIEEAKDTLAMQDIVSSYNAILPTVAENRFWEEVITHVYRIIADCAQPMFPSIVRSVSDKREGECIIGVNEVDTLEWRTPNSESQRPGYFDSPISENPCFRSIVTDLGFPLIECPCEVQAMYSDSLEENRRGDILEVTPASLINHLSSNVVEDVGLSPIQLPKPISDTVIQDTCTLQAILEYCSQYEDFKDNTEALPLLLTSDGLLRTFATERPVYSTEFDYLFSSSSSNFLDKSIRNYFSEDFDVISHFDISSVADFLRNELCPTKFNCNQYIQWDKSEPTQEWISGLWECLAACTSRDDGLQCLSTWNIVPCRKKEATGVVYHLVPLSKATSVVNKLSGMSNIFTALSSLGVSEVDHFYNHPEAEQLITRLVAHEDKPDTMVAVLDHVIQTNPSQFDQLTSDQRDHILQYITTHMPERLMKNGDNRKIIKDLPCYKQLDGAYISLSQSPIVYVIKGNLSCEEMLKWMAEYNATFLREDYGLKELFKAVGCIFVSECEALFKFIFPKFDLLSSETRLQYLETLSKHKRTMEVGGEHCMKLQSFQLLENSAGVLRRGRDFFDQGNRVFQEMLSENKFPSKEIIDKLGHSFVLKFGVQCKVTADMFLEYANELSMNLGKEKKERKKLAEQSKTLVNELFRNCTLHTDVSFLKRIKLIDFIVTDAPELSLAKLHAYHMDINMGVRFDSSSVHENKELVWCSMRLLPEYISSIESHCHCHRSKDFILEKLGVVNKPVIESVIENTRKMCCNVHDQEIRDFQVLSKVMKTAYHYFNSACDRHQENHRCGDRTDRCRACQMMSDKLSDVPCVVIQTVPPLVKPDSVCRLSCGDLFQPHLYQLPDSLIPFSKFLYCLGSTPTPSFRQLAKVLNGLASHSTKEVKNPNMLQAIMSASKLFLQEIESLTSGATLKTLQADLEDIQIVHLPGSSKGQLLPSTEIFIKDNTDHTKRLVRSHVPFMPDELTKLFKNAQSLIDSFPQHLRPRSLKACVIERVGTSARPCLYQQNGQCKFGTRLNGIIKSLEFSEAVKRLIEEGCDTGIDADHEGIAKLHSLQLQCMAELPTFLFIDGMKIEGSLANPATCMNTEDGACIKVTHTEDNERSAYIEVVKGVAQAVVQHVDMLSADSSREIPKLLRNYKLIRPNEQTEDHDEGIAPPKLGSRIPTDILHLLEQNLYLRFIKGEYVAYQLDNDLGEHVVPIHIYAQVLDIPENLLSPLRNKYLIDVGAEDPLWVSGLNLFKFLIPDEPVETGMSIIVYCHPSDGHGPEDPASRQTPPTTDVPQTEVPPKPQPYPDNIDEAKEEVSNQLEEIWELDEEERKKAIRRMYLRWHPDKHPEERKIFATEVFKHLQNEIERLKAGRKRTGKAGNTGKSSSSDPRGGGSFFDDDFFEFMRNWAREEGRRRESYQRNFRESGYFGNSRSRHCPPSFDDAPEPDMPRASVWFKQAKSDLAASSNDFDKEAYEWVCFKSYHAAEKALKAALFASRGTSNHSHNLDVLVTDLKGQFRNETLTDRAHQLNRLVDVSVCLYPKDRVFLQTSPCEIFSRTDSERATLCASDIVRIIQKHFKL
ncbi:sacsin-like [Lytechinus pictus]|uniref:sacsin-like n=1 Tax=Lytechinus pictus TaxID=7653 RepID=UPI0030B9C6E4